jgi:flagellar basal-body rod protein FlgC
LAGTSNWFFRVDGTTSAPGFDLQQYRQRANHSHGKGGPFQRQDVVFVAEGDNPALPKPIAARRGNLGLLQGGVKTTEITTDTEAGPRVYDPTHPDADADGYVNQPNVDIVVEMTNMLSATRSYEANLAAIEAVKRMALKALEIGR